MSNTTVDYTNKKFLVSNEPVMKLAIDIVEILSKIDKITMKGTDEFCPATVSIANIVTQNMLKGTTKTEKISVDSEILDDGRMISTIEIIIAKIGN